MTDNDYAALDNGYDEYDHKAIDAALEAEAERMDISKPVGGRWLRHDGGVCPVSDGDLVEVRYRDGTEPAKDTASCWIWRHTNDDDDITAYQVCALADQLERLREERASFQRVYIQAMQEIEQIKSGWLRAVDDNMTSSHVGVANASDTYHEARKKLSDLIEWHVQVATDPCVNGGFVLVKVPDPDIDITSDSLCDMIEGSPPASENEALQALLSRKSGFTTSPVGQKK